MSQNPAFSLASGPIMNPGSSGNKVQDTSGSEGPGYGEDTHPWQNADLPTDKHDQNHTDQSKETDSPFCDVLRDRLRNNSVVYPSQGSGLSFWPKKLFDSLVGQKDVKRLLEEMAQTDVTTDNESSIDDATETITKRYRKILALLLLIGQGNKIHEFVSREIEDKCLPFPPNYTFEGLIERSDCVSILKDYQWKLNVPFFGPLEVEPGDLHGNVSHLDLSKRDIRPWERLDMKPKQVPRGDHGLLSAQTTKRTVFPSSVPWASGYGGVCRIIIHPWQHEFHDVLEKVSFPDPCDLFIHPLSANLGLFQVN